MRTKTESESAAEGGPGHRLALVTGALMLGALLGPGGSGCTRAPGAAASGLGSGPVAVDPVRPGPGSRSVDGGPGQPSATTSAISR